MSDMDGFSLCSRHRADPCYQDTLSESKVSVSQDAWGIMERLEQKCETAEAMINRLLKFSETAPLPCLLVSVDADALIRALFADLSSLELSRSITLEIMLQPFLPSVRRFHASGTVVSEYSGKCNQIHPSAEGYQPCVKKSVDPLSKLFITLEQVWA